MFKNVNALCRVMFEESNSVVSAEAQVIETAVPASRVSQTETRFSNIPLQSERRASLRQMHLRNRVFKVLLAEASQI
jgi:hypothetical protein